MPTTCRVAPRTSGYIDHNYIGHNYIGHNYICHNYVGHNYIGSTEDFWFRSLGVGPVGSLRLGLSIPLGGFSVPTVRVTEYDKKEEVKTWQTVGQGSVVGEKALRLAVTIHGAKGLRPLDHQACNRYVRVRVGTKSRLKLLHTEISNQDSNPSWDETHMLVGGDVDEVVLELWHRQIWDRDVQDPQDHYAGEVALVSRRTCSVGEVAVVTSPTCEVIIITLTDVL